MRDSWQDMWEAAFHGAAFLLMSFQILLAEGVVHLRRDSCMAMIMAMRQIIHRTRRDVCRNY